MKDIFRALGLLLIAVVMFVYGVTITVLSLWYHTFPTEVQLYRETILLLVWYIAILKADKW